jgi:hypothetical protein
MEAHASKVTSSACLQQVRGFAKERLLSLLGYVRGRARLSPDYIVLVLDEPSAHLVNS